MPCFSIIDFGETCSGRSLPRGGVVLLDFPTPSSMHPTLFLFPVTLESTLPSFGDSPWSLEQLHLACSSVTAIDRIRKTVGTRL